jgi:hypothetical protein
MSMHHYPTVQLNQVISQAEKVSPPTVSPSTVSPPTVEGKISQSFCIDLTDWSKEYIFELRISQVELAFLLFSLSFIVISRMNRVA